MKESNLQPYRPLEPIRFNQRRVMLLIAERDGNNFTYILTLNAITNSSIKQ